MHKKLIFNRQKIVRVALAALSSFLRIAFIIGSTFVIIYPLIIMLSKSFNVDYNPENLIGESQAMAAERSIIWLPRVLGFDNFKVAIDLLDYWKSILNTFINSFFSGIFQAAFCAMIGYGLARFKFREKSLIIGIIVFTIIMPIQTISVPLFLKYRFFDLFGLFELITGNPINLIDNFLTFWIPSILGVGLRSGLYILIFMQFFRNMPKDMESAASIDGSGAWGTFLKIMAPNAIPTFLTVFLFSLVWHWNDYFISSMFLPKNQTIMVKLVDVGLRTNLAGGNMDQRYLQAAMAVLAITPLVIVFGFAQKYFVESMDRAGIKG